MGLWQGIKNVGGAIAKGIGNVGGELISGAANLFGGSQANKANIKLQREANQFSAQQAQKQMDFQENMSNSAYQRSMADMKKAGLNPMLAYAQGGASSPTGAQGSVQSATVENTIGPAMATALDVRRVRKELQMADSQTKLNDATAGTQHAQTQLAITNAKVAQKNADILDAQMPTIRKQMKRDGLQADYDTDMIDYDNISKRVGQGVGIINDAKSAINPMSLLRGRGRPKPPGGGSPNGRREKAKAYYDELDRQRNLEIGISSGRIVPFPTR